MPTRFFPAAKLSMLFIPRLRPLLVAALFCAVVLLTACDRQTVFRTAAGNDFSLSAHAGKWIVINYWAPWCAPCRKEIPELNRLARKYPHQVVVLGVHLDGLRGAALHGDIRKMKIDFIVLEDNPGPALGLDWPHVVPTTWVLNPQGEKHKKLLGPQTYTSLLNAVQIR